MSFKISQSNNQIVFKHGKTPLDGLKTNDTRKKTDFIFIIKTSICAKGL